jgi:hypothetical protein
MSASDNAKSTLVLGQPLKKESTKAPPEPQGIEYKQVSNLNDFVGELSD